ncbi:MAG: YARHG domain-containing protein [Myxococcales bacterium]|nr:YARHG domain-containing protein [Myxococcales bacterium]
MIQLFTLVAALAAPNPSVAECHAWAKAEKVTQAQTNACLRRLLSDAYGGKMDGELLTLDPNPATKWEPDFLKEDLERALKHHKTVCYAPTTDPATLCGRSEELFTRQIGRKMSLFEDVNVGSFEAVLGKIIAGQKLTKEDLTPSPDAGFSALTLWKLRNAAYARHGYKFKKQDLNDFFYGPRTGDQKLDNGMLPLTHELKANVTLTAEDGANVRLIKEFEARLK